MLNGEKWFVTSEGDPGFYSFWQSTGDEQMLFVVEPDTPGLEIVRTPRFSMTRTSTHHPEIVFRDCRVPEENRIPEGGGDGAGSGSRSSGSSSPRAAAAPRTRLLDVASEWAQEREAFGSRLSEHQGVAFPLADSLTELLAARLLTYHAANAFDTLEDRRVVHGKVAMAKLFASEMANRVADRALQVFGGRGYMVENPAARFYRELRVDRIWEGTSEIQRLVIARGLFKRGAAAYLA